MEPIRHTLTARLGYLKLYREDVDELVTMFAQSCEKVTISDSKHRFEDLDDMKRNVAAKITDFDLRGEKPDIRFLFNQTEIVRVSSPPTQATFNELRTEEISDAADALFYKVKDLLVSHQQPRAKKGLLFGAAVSFVCLFWFAYINMGRDEHGQAILAFRALPGLLLCLAALLIFVVTGTNIKNYLSLDTKRNSPSFFVRNREEFAKQATTAAISSIIGGLIGYCIGHFLK
jgi:hypothetical protein